MNWIIYYCYQADFEVYGRETLSIFAVEMPNTTSLSSREAYELWVQEYKARYQSLRALALERCFEGWHDKACQPYYVERVRALLKWDNAVQPVEAKPRKIIPDVGWEVFREDHGRKISAEAAWAATVAAGKGQNLL